MLFLAHTNDQEQRPYYWLDNIFIVNTLKMNIKIA